MLLKTITVICMFLCCVLHLNGQSSKVMTELRAGHNTVYGGFASISLDASYDLKQHMSISGGIQYNTIGKFSTEVRPSYFHVLDWGIISAEAMLHYSNVHTINNFAVGAGIALSSRWIYCKAGYYFRAFGSRAGFINEPFNIFYKFSVNCLPMISRWDLQLYLTNCETFELERHYQPSFVAQCWYYPTGKIGLTLGASYKPAGMFHLSADYYQFYTKAGVCYRW